MSGPVELVRRVARGTGFSDVRRIRAQVDLLEEAIHENRRLDALLEAELRVLEQQVADVAQAFLDRR